MVAGDHKLQLPGEIRRVVQHANPLVKGAHDNLILLGINVLDSFFQIAYAAVNNFGGCARSRSGEIAGIEHDRAKSAQLGVKGTPRASRSAADHANIKRFARDILELLVPRFHKFTRPFFKMLFLCGIRIPPRWVCANLRQRRRNIEKPVGRGSKVSLEAHSLPQKPFPIQEEASPWVFQWRRMDRRSWCTRKQTQLHPAADLVSVRCSGTPRWSDCFPG